MSDLARRLLALFVLCLATVALAACGGGDGEEGGEEEEGDAGGSLEEPSEAVQRRVTMTVTTFHKSFADGDGGNTCDALGDEGEMKLMRMVRGATDCPDAVSKLEKARNDAKVPPIKVTGVMANSKRAEAELEQGAPVKLVLNDRKWEITDPGGALNQPQAKSQAQ